jgi:hypothetical protein
VTKSGSFIRDKKLVFSLCGNSKTDSLALSKKKSGNYDAITGTKVSGI